MSLIASERVLLIIPARLASTRLPRKMLLSLSLGSTGENNGGEVVVLDSTYNRVLQSKYATRSNTVIATCDSEIEIAAKKFGCSKVCLTSPTCTSGSDRIAEAMEGLMALSLHSRVDIVVNVQGDEPFLNPQHLNAAIEGLARNEWADVATCAVQVGGPSTADPSKVKVVTSCTGSALYFSRACIAPNSTTWLRHIGVYAYRPAVLRAFSKAAPSKLEKAENLEQLRLLEANYKIHVTTVKEDGFGGIDTPEDLERARVHWRNLQRGRALWGEVNRKQTSCTS